MVIDAVGGAFITACCGIVMAIVAKLRCRFLVSNQGDDDWDWSLACGFTEVKLPQPDSKMVEVIPLQADTIYIKKNE